MSFRIRPLEEKDCALIGPLLREIWLVAYKGIMTEGEMLEQSHKVHTADQIRDEIGNDRVYSIVAEVGGQLVGHARGDLEDQYVEIVRLFLKDAHYGKGIGKAMLTAIEDHFAQTSDFRLDVFEENTRAFGFYISQGYEVVERSSEIQSQGVDVFDLKMRKWIDRSI